MSKLAEIQQALKAPKGQKNSFGNYNYRSCEDILEAVKPLLGEWHLTLSDDIVEVGGRVYVKATATLDLARNAVTDGHGPSYIATAFAREAETKKGMDDAQITGSASSYARKYALNGLFCIDDTKDADHTNTHGRAPQRKQPAPVKDKGVQKVSGKKALSPELAKAKADFSLWVDERRKGMFDDENDTPAFLKLLWKNQYGTEAYTDPFQLENLKTRISSGQVNMENGETMEAK
jgi:hypothetical protein